MTLRRKFSLLLASFAGFAVLAAAATIYAVQWRVESAVGNFEHALDRTVQIDRLRVALKEQGLYLRELVNGRREAAEDYFPVREEFFANLRQVSRFGTSDAVDPGWDGMLHLAREIEETSDQLLALIQASRMVQAGDLLDSRLDVELLPAMDAQLHAAKGVLDDARKRAVAELSTTSRQTFALTIFVAALAAALTVLGTWLIRRWLIAPVAVLQEATRQFSRGNFSYRASLSSHDELREFGDALNTMARSVADAQDRLRASETKHRTLFRSLRDAVVICDLEGRIVEFHDGETRILGVEGHEPVGCNVLDVWPEWRAVGVDWSTVIDMVIRQGRRYTAVDVELAAGEGGDGGVYADFLVYRIEVGEARYAATVVRDVTERHHLQRRVRRAETMEAVGTLAGGLAHDFNNLLTSVIGTLSMLASETKDSPHGRRVQTALRACWQAAGLSRRLLNFASSTHGDPQLFCLKEALELIVESLDPPFLEGVELSTQWDGSLTVRMDRDQFTQIVLNLLRNARDAMPDGGRLSVRLESVTTNDSEDAARRRSYAVVVVQDSGDGMTSETRERLFEPFFTTKSRASRRGRGMGMAIVYAAVKNAGGFIRVESQPGRGTTFRVHLPTAEPLGRCEGLPEAPKSVEEPGLTHAGHGAVLWVDEDPMILEVWSAALESWGYSVTGARNSVDALARLASNGAGDCMLAIVDMDVADGPGTALAKRLVELKPNLRIILTSGSTEKPLPASLERYVCAALTKPFRPDALAAAVSAAFSSSSSSM